MTLTSDIAAHGVGTPARSQCEAIEFRIDAIVAGVEADTPSRAADELLQLSEDILEIWVRARGEKPTIGTREGFRLLALHRQGARGEPSFNACRETARELAYHYNLVQTEAAHPQIRHRLLLMAMLAKHLCLFVSGKMQVAGLGEFCCAAKPVREGDA